MNLELLRLRSEATYSLGVLLEKTPAGSRWLAWTLEDEHREEKVPGQTRIPPGTYRLALRTEGGLHARYSARFPELHRGMLWLQGVPGFSWIYLHIGNTEAHTDGCLLVGDQILEGSLGHSAAAYLRLYPPIAAALERGESVTLTVADTWTTP